MLLDSTQSISGRGPISSCSICFVAGHPTTAEWNNRQLLNGRQSELFLDLCKTAGISPSKCYYTVVIKHYEKSYAKLIQFKKTDAVLSPDFVAYEQYLFEELSLCSANVYVALDDIALYTLTRKKSAAKYRGSILESTLLPGKKVIPTIPPASAWSQYLFRHYILYDLMRVRDDSSTPDLNLPDPALVLKPSFLEAKAFIEECNSHQIVAFDIETSKGQLDCFSLSYGEDTSICIPLIERFVPYFSLEQEADILLSLAALLKNPKVTKVLQNGIYDATFLYERYGMTINNVEDTMIAYGLIAPDFPKSLAFLASVYTRHPYYKDEGKERFKGFYTDDTEFWKYSARDSLVTLEVWHVLKNYLSGMGLSETYASHIAIIHPLIEMLTIGYTMNKSAMDLAAEEIAKEVLLLTEKLSSLCGYPINPNSPKQLCEYFYGVKKLKPYLKDKKPTTDVTAMQRLATRGYEEAILVVNLRRLRKFSSTYLKMQLDEQNKLRCSYNPIGANTGRLSSSAHILGHGGNRQNLPKRGKLSVYPYILQRPDYIPYSLDLSGAENRIVAYYGPVPKMIAAFEAGLDVHRLTASLLFNISYAEVSDEPGSAGIMGSDKSQRDMGKMFNHSGNYGVGAPTLALKNNMPLAPVRDGLNQYHTVLYPEVKQQFQAQIIEQLRTNSRTVQNCLGRTRKFMDRWGDDMFQDAFAFPAQSTIADIINRRGLAFSYLHLPQIHLVNQIHDSIEFEISSHLPWTFHAKLINSLLTSLEQPLEWQGRVFTIPCDLEVRHGTYAHSKKIKKPSRNIWQLSKQLSLSYESLC